MVCPRNGFAVLTIGLDEPPCVGRGSSPVGLYLHLYIYIYILFIPPALRVLAPTAELPSVRQHFISWKRFSSRCIIFSGGFLVPAGYEGLSALSLAMSEAEDNSNRWRWRYSRSICSSPVLPWDLFGPGIVTRYSCYQVPGINYYSLINKSIATAAMCRNSISG